MVGDKLRVILVFVVIIAVEFSPIKADFTTVQACVDSLTKAGDVCEIPSGTYREEVIIKGKRGTAKNPIVIRGTGDDRPIIEGTIDLEPEAWTRYEGADEISVDGELIEKPIYMADISQYQDIWQLFVDGEMMTNARWPNALWSDKSIFDGKNWARVDKKTKEDGKGLMIDDGTKDLAGSGLDVTGAVAILNIGSFNTYSAIVKSHEKGSNTFSYDATFKNKHFKAKKSRYFLEDKLEFLDQPGEWFYNKDTKELYIWANDGGNLTGHKVTGKVRTYSFTITDCKHVIFENLEFHATTLQARSPHFKNNYVSDLTFKSISFNYPSYSKRMLKEAKPPKWTYVGGNKKRDIFSFYNNTFYGSDGVPLQLMGLNITLENNLFEYNDWTGANMETFAGGMGTIVLKGPGSQFVRNTMRYNGASAGYRPNGANPRIELNHFHHQCWGNIQSDGSHVQLQIGAQRNALLLQNWVHDSPKFGLRFDGQPPRLGTKGTMKRNVVWNCNGLMVKGKSHNVYGNLAFSKKNDVGGDGQATGCMLCVLKYVRENPVPINYGTIVMYNAADVANGGIHKKKMYAVAGKIVTKNVMGNSTNKLDIKKYMVDPSNQDFRPRVDTPLTQENAGPYLNVTDKYWIPGRQEYKACTPIPPDDRSTVKAADRDALMWLNGLGATTHHVFFGTNKFLVKEATIDSPEFKSTIQNNGNVYYLSETLQKGTTYYWRVDAEINENTVYRGDVWSFTTKG